MATQSSEERNFDIRRREPEQPALFATEDLVIPDAVRSIRKAVAAVHAVPTQARHTPSLNGRRLFDALIVVAQLYFKRRGRECVEQVKEGYSPTLETSAAELSKLAGIKGKNYQRVYEDLAQLYEMDLRWNVVGEDKTVEYDMRSHFLSSLGIGKGKKKGHLRFSIDARVLAIVLEPTMWASLSLQAMQGLGSAAAYALYQNCWKYIGTVEKVTAEFPTATWIELIVGQSRYVQRDPATGEQIVNYGDFKRRVLTPALEAVNASPALAYTLELRERKRVNRVVALQFKFVKKQQEALELNWPTDLVDFLKSIGFSDGEIADMSQAHSSEEVSEAAMQLPAAEARLRSKGERIYSTRKSYFKGILANIAEGVAAADIDHDKVASQVQAAEAKRAAQERQQRLEEQFARHQADRFSETLFALSQPRRADILDDFERSPEGAKARVLLEKGWSPSNVGALSMLRTYLSDKRPAVFEEMLPNAEDRTFNGWMAWKLDSAG